MSFRDNLLKVSIVILLMIAGCKENPTEPTATKASSISGTVLDAGNNPLVLARVIDIGSLAQVDTSKTDGSYTLKMELSDNYNTSVYAILPGYSSDTQKVSLTPGDNKTGVNIHMKVVDSSKIVGGNSGRAASIGLLSQTTKSILLKGGINQSCTLTFLVVDSLNRPVTGTNSCKVKFSISVSNPSGESLKPDTAQTDPLTGQVTTTIFSGTKPNAILVTAQVIDPTRKITATAGLTEGTGLPDGNHVSISASKFNIAGRVYDGLSTTITMTVHDQFGNPVDDGTPVSFVTNGGGIIKDAFTKDGAATAALMSGGGNPPTGGWVTVTAEVKGDTSIRKADSSIVRTIQILFSGHTTVALGSNAVNFEVPDGDLNFFDFTVSDDNGNPLVEGSTIDVTVDSFNEKLKSSVELKGDNKITMPDVKDILRTHFRVWVIDKNKDSLSGIITFRIKITSPNGNIDQDWFSGYMRGTSSGIGFLGVPASIALADSSIRKLYLSETQLPDTSTRVTFIVKDGNGFPISTARKALVTFSLLQAPSGAYLSTTQDSTGAGGAVTVTISAGNVPGTAQIVARTTDGLGNFFSALSMPIEIAHGLPDSNQIFISLPQNMFNNMGNLVGTLKVNVADINGNFPAPEFVQFSTSGGVISPIAALLDAGGSASTGLYGGKVPIDPIKGFGNVSVILKVHGGVTVTRKTPFLFSGAPIITTLNIPSSDTIIISDAGFFDLDYVVADENGNPLVKGNSIQVSVSGFAASGIILNNTSNVTPGTTDLNTIHYRVRVGDAVANGGVSGNFDITISVNGPSGSATRHFYGILRTAQEINIPSPEVKKAAQIAFYGITATDIYVSDVGALNNATITYEVRDSLGLPVASSPRYGATYNINFFPNSTIGGGTYPKVIPSTDSTDSQGRLRASIVSGTQAGVIEVVAQIVLDNGKIIISQPVKITVHAGFPDQNHFTLMPSRFVFPSMDYLYTPYPKFTVAIGDTFSNPVSKGTAVYFHSQAGIIETGFDDFKAYTDMDGLATVGLLTVNPEPDALPYYDPIALSGRIGGSWVYVQTQNRNGGQIIDSVLVIWNQAPIVVTGIPASITLPHFSSSAYFNITVKDANGNPLCDGTTISAAFNLPPGITGLAFDVSGSFSVQYPAVIPIAAYARFPGVNITDFTFNVIDISTSEPANSFSAALVLIINAPGVDKRIISIPVTIN
ncbi:MAG: Ig-like domain-containing protein [Bacteroidota bacterium]